MKRSSIKRLTPLRRVSPKRQALNVQYRAACDQWRAQHDGRCEMRFDASGNRAHRNSQGPRCRSTQIQLHHTKGRGPFLCDVSTFIGLCMTCHRWVDTHRNQAVELGYFTYTFSSTASEPTE